MYSFLFLLHTNNGDLMIKKDTLKELKADLKKKKEDYQSSFCTKMESSFLMALSFFAGLPT